MNYSVEEINGYDIEKKTPNKTLAGIEVVIKVITRSSEELEKGPAFSGNGKDLSNGNKRRVEYLFLAGE